MCTLAMKKVYKEISPRVVVFLLHEKCNIFDYMPEGSQYRIFADVKIDDAEPVELFRPLEDGLVVAFPKISKQKTTARVLLLGETIVNKANAIALISNLFIVVREAIYRAIGTKIGQIRPFDLGNGMVGILRLKGAVLPTLITCEPVYDPDDSAICTDDEPNYVYPAGHIPINNAPLPSLVDAARFAYCMQTDARHKMQHSGRAVLDVLLTQMFGLDRVPLCVDTDLANLCPDINAPFQSRLEWTLAYFGALRASVTGQLFADALVTKYLTDNVFLLSVMNRTYLSTAYDYFQLVKHFLSVCPEQGSIVSSSDGTCTLSVYNDTCVALKLCTGTKTYKTTAESQGLAVQATCGRFFKDMGGLDGLHSLYTLRQTKDFAGMDLSEYRFYAQKHCLLSHRHVCFYLQGKDIYSASFTGSRALCKLTELSTMLF